MIRIAIVEDEQECIEKLKEYLKQFSEESGEQFEIKCYTDGAAFIERFKSQFDLILMDVEMPLLNGMESAELIRQSDPEVMIIFITNMAQYAIRGYAVDALDYLLKPVSYFVFSQRLFRALGRMRRRQYSYLTVQVKGGVMKLETRAIYYVESQGHKLIYHTRTGEIETRGTLKEVEQTLISENFFRCNNGYLVNLAHVDGVCDGSVLVNGEKLLISRPRKAEFMGALTEYMGGMG